MLDLVALVLIVIGLFFMDLAGFTLNTSTLIAIGMSVGVLVKLTCLLTKSQFTRSSMKAWRKSGRRFW